MAWFATSFYRCQSFIKLAKLQIAVAVRMALTAEVAGQMAPLECSADVENVSNAIAATSRYSLPSKSRRFSGNKNRKF